ncbi:hypothetical protein [Leifsonia poae]|uniref:YxiG-like protein n=1 Tax=Leifsonia poae TaxID=110933 RepID=UPI003D668EC9
MDIPEIQSAFENAFDEALIFHGFTDYMRDYEMVLQLSADPRTGIPTEFLRYVFVNCVEAKVSTALTPETWSRSLDERLIDDETGSDFDGYVWGVKWQDLDPGFELVSGSETARSWSGELGIRFLEARVQTNGHNLTLVFSDLRVEKAAPGYAPFTVGSPLSGGTIPG